MSQTAAGLAFPEAKTEGLRDSRSLHRPVKLKHRRVIGEAQNELLRYA
jgi:hypothetical protein